MLIFIRVVVFVVWGFGLVSTAGAGIITVAGSGATGFGEGGFSGDGGAATDARLNEPHGIALDGSGNLYISDRFNHRIRKVDASGTITTVAGSGATGSGEGGFSGDGGAATDARLNLPRGIALDGSGNLYIADTKNHRIRKVDASGTITTVAGSDDTGVFGGFSGDGGPATDAQLAFPHGIALDDSGNLYIADTNNLRIRKVDASGVITTVAGNGKSAFSGDGSPATGVSLNFPTAVVADASGNLFIADTGNHRIRKVPALAIELSANPSRITADGTDAATIEARLELQGVLKSDDNQSRVTFSISSGTGSLSDTEVTVTGGIGPTTLTSGSLGTVIVQASTPGAVDATVEVTVIAGVITTVAGSGDPGPFGAFSGDGGQATAARLHNPVDVFADGSGNLYIADRNNNVIRKVDASGIITTVAGADDFGGFSGDGGPATDAELRFPSGVYVDDEGNLYIGDALNNRIRKVDASGVITTVAGNGEEGFSGDGGAATDARLNFPTDLSLDGSGNLFIVDPGNHRVRKVDASGVITTVAGSGETGGFGDFSGDGGPATAARLASPSDVSVDGSGNLFIADWGNDRIRKVDPSGTITTVAGPGGLFQPTSVFVDGLGNLYVADTLLDQILKVDASGAITTVAGSVEGFSGDGGPPTDASLDEPRGIYIDGSGNLFIADRLNHRIRKVPLGPPLTLNLSANPTKITSDGSDAATIEARLELGGVLQTGDNQSSVTFSVSSGTGSLSDMEVTATGGIASTTLTSNSPGTVIVQASTPGTADATVKVTVTVHVTADQIMASDFNASGTVDFFDFLEFTQNFNKKDSDADFDPKYDLNGSGTVDFFDFLDFSIAFDRSV